MLYRGGIRLGCYIGFFVIYLLLLKVVSAFINHGNNNLSWFRTPTNFTIFNELSISRFNNSRTWLRQ